jgi:cutinase
MLCSQGCLCARKSLDRIGNAGDRISSFVCFGDPASVWEDTISFPPLPSGAADIGFCSTAPTDPLCGSVADNWPSDAQGVIDHLKDIFNSFDQASLNDAQKSALGSIIVELPKQAIRQLTTLAGDIIDGHLQRWMLTPQHFLYGMDGSVDQAAD